MAVSIALLNRLNKNEEPLETRLKLASAVFESIDFPSHKKEEIVLKWLCELEAKYSVKVWLLLKNCFTSSKWNSCNNISIATSVRSLICQVLCDSVTCSKLPEKLSLLIKECTVLALENIYLQHHFKYNLEDFFTLVSVTLKSCINNEDFVVRILKCIQILHNQVFQKDYFAQMFMKLTVQAVALTCEKCGPLVQAEAVQCVQQVLFPKSVCKEISNSLRLLFDSGNNEIVKNQNVGLLLELLGENETESSDLFVLLFRSFVTAQKNDAVAILRLFILLCYFLGFRSKVSSGEDSCCMIKHKDFRRVFPDNHIKKVKEKTSLPLNIVLKMVQTLISTNVHLETEECKFLSWLQALVMSSLDTVSPELMELLSAVIDLSPQVLEPNMDIVLEKVAFVKKNSDTQPAYTAFICRLLKMYAKLSRMQKLIAKLLTLASQRELPLLIDVLPQEFCTEFCSLVALLPSWQAVATMKTFLFHLSSDCVQVLERDAILDQPLPILSVQMTSTLLSHFLRGTRIADHSTPKQVLIKFSDIMSELAELLGRLGQALLQREHNCHLMLAYMQLCYHWGELEVLLIHYTELDVNSKLKLSALYNDVSATNLTFLHPYLTSEMWNLVAQRVSNFGEAECKEIMAKMVLQKFRAVTLFAEEEKKRQEIVTVTARHIVHNIRDSWHLVMNENNAALITPLLSPEELDSLSVYLVQELAVSTTDNTALFIKLTQPGIQENRLFVVALVCAILGEFRKLFSRTKRKRDVQDPTSSFHCLAKEVLSKINPKLILHSMAEKKHEELLPLVLDMGALVNAYLEQPQEVTSVSELNEVTFERLVDLLHLLPIRCLLPALKNLLLVSIFAILISIKNWQVDLEIEKKLHRMLLLGIEDGQEPSNIANVLNVGLVAHWLLDNELKLTEVQHDLLLHRLFESSLRAGLLESLHTAIPLLNTTEAEVAQIKKSICAANILLEVLHKHSKNILNVKDKESSDALYHHLSKGILKAMKNKETAEFALKGFKLLLSGFLEEGNKKKILKMVPYFGKAISVCLTHLPESQVSPSPEICMETLSVLFKHHSDLENHLPKNLITNTWSVLICCENALVTTQENLRTIIEATSEKEINDILQSLMNATKLAIKNEENLNSKLRVWQAVASSVMSGCRMGVQKAVLEQLYMPLASWILKIEEPNALLALQELLLEVARNPTLHVSPKMLDLCFMSIKEVNCGLPSEVLDLSTQSECLLRTLLQRHTSSVLDRTPAFLQCYRQIANRIAALSSVDTELSPLEKQKCTCSAQGLERLMSLLKDHKAHFARIAAYLVADTLHLFENYTFRSQEKLHFTNCVYILLSMCDTHALAFLSRSSSSASQQLLKTFLTNYYKYHRFTGKI